MKLVKGSCVKRVFKRDFSSRRTMLFNRGVGGGKPVPMSRTVVGVKR